MVNQRDDFDDFFHALKVEKRKEVKRTQVFSVLIILFMIIAIMISGSKSLSYQSSPLLFNAASIDENGSRLYADLLARSITGLMLQTPGKLKFPRIFSQ